MEPNNPMRLVDLRTFWQSMGPSSLSSFGDPLTVDHVQIQAGQCDGPGGLSCNLMLQHTCNASHKRACSHCHPNSNSRSSSDGDTSSLQVTQAHSRDQLDLSSLPLEVLTTILSHIPLRVSRLFRAAAPAAARHSDTLLVLPAAAASAPTPHVRARRFTVCRNAWVRAPLSVAAGPQPVQAPARP